MVPWCLQCFTSMKYRHMTGDWSLVVAPLEMRVPVVVVRLSFISNVAILHHKFPYSGFFYNQIAFNHYFRWLLFSDTYKYLMCFTKLNVWYVNFELGTLPLHILVTEIVTRWCVGVSDWLPHVDCCAVRYLNIQTGQQQPIIHVGPFFQIWYSNSKDHLSQRAPYLYIYPFLKL